MKTKTFLIILSVFLTLFFSASASAESQMVAAVNIYNAKIISQEDGRFKISFNLSNDKGVQPDIKYAIMLVGQGDDNQTVVDEKIYPEAVTLGEGQAVYKKIEYEAPEYLNGKFQIWLFAKNTGGLTLAFSDLREVELNGSGEFLEIVSDSCFMKVESESGEKKEFKQGAFVEKGEKINAVCDIANYYGKKASFTPLFTTYRRGVFGGLVETAGEPQKNHSLAAGEKKEFSFNIPVVSEPQVYSAVLDLVSDDDGIVSNKFVFYYVLRGASATVQNFTLDKDYYIKGETAKLSLFWSAGKSADVSAAVSVKNRAGENCADSLIRELDINSRNVVIDIPVASDCVDPQVSLSLKNGDGNVFDQRNYFIETRSEIKRWHEKYSIFIALLIVALLIIAVWAFNLIRDKKIKPYPLFLVVFFGAFLLSANSANAYTYYNIYGAIITFNIDKSTYVTQENVTASASACYTGNFDDESGGSQWDYVTLTWYVKINNNILTLWSNELIDNANKCYWGNPPKTASVTGTAQSNSGNFKAEFTDDYDPYSGHWMPVPGAPINIYYDVVGVSAFIWANDVEDSITIPYNTAVDISWESFPIDKITSCSVSVNGFPTGWTGITGYQSAGNLTSSKTYTVNCASLGSSAQDSVTVNVSPPPCSIALGVHPAGSGTAAITSGVATYTCGDGNISAATAAASANYSFQGWDTTGDLVADYTSGINPLNISHGQNWNITALFAVIVNQPPVITAPDTVTYPIERSGTFTFSVSDPDDSSNVFSWRWQYPTHSSYCGDSASGFPSGSINVPFNSGTITVTPTYYPDEGCDGDPGLIISAYDGEATTEKTISFIPDIISPPGSFNLSLNGSASCNSVPLTWTQSSGADYYKILRGSSRVDITPYQPYTAQNYTDSTPIQGEQYIYQIESYNAGGDNRSNAINVDVPYCLPAVSLSANPTSIYQGQITTLTWTSSNTIWCSASGAWSGSKPLSGNEEDKPSPPSAVYYLTCGGPGGTNTVAATVEVLPLALPEWREIIPR